MNEESSLISRAQRGDAQAYESLVRQYEQMAFRAAYLITRDEFEAAEAAQDAFLRAFRALHSFRKGMPFRPWLLRIVTNLALNRVKGRERREKATERYHQEAMVTRQGDSVEEVLAAKEQNDRLLAAVQRLTPEDQSLLALRYFLELSEAEVAQALDIPVGTVKSRLHRTLARLRDVIAREFPDLSSLAS